MTNMLRILPQSLPTAQLHEHLLGAIAPRPICFASTLNAEGIPNLAPYSFFNVFSSNPPIAVFSSNRTIKDNRAKDTLANIEATGEVVINVVTHNMVRQMALCSINYPSSISEFAKAGFTPLPSELVKPFRVTESPVQLECRVRQIMPLGDSGGAGNLIICDIVLLHINPDILDEDGKIDPQKIDLVARMGRAFYCRASGDAIFKLFQSVEAIGIGFEQLPTSIRHSSILTGNDLAELAALTQLPTPNDYANLLAEQPQLRALLLPELSSENNLILHRLAKVWIADGKAANALTLLYYS